MNSKLSISIGAFCLICAGSAFAQSHSVTNMANPPKASAASDAAIDATPNQTGHDKKANKPNAKKKKPVKKAPSKEEGAQGAMQHAPSEHTVNESEKRAFDNAPAR